MLVLTTYYYLLLTTHYSLLTPRYSLLTTYYYLILLDTTYYYLLLLDTTYYLVLLATYYLQVCHRSGLDRAVRRALISRLKRAARAPQGFADHSFDAADQDGEAAASVQAFQEVEDVPDDVTRSTGVLLVVSSK